MILFALLIFVWLPTYVQTAADFAVRELPSALFPYIGDVEFSSGASPIWPAELFGGFLHVLPGYLPVATAKDPRSPLFGCVGARPAGNFG